jgi:gluconokinase
LLGNLRRSAPLALVVMGVSGSGKSTLGTALAGAIGCPFFEGDDFHAAESVSRMRAGLPLTDEDRWPWLERLGLAIGGGLAAGGFAIASCSALKRSYRDRLRATIAAPVGFVLLEGAPEELRRRMAARADHYMPASLLDSQLATLERPRPDEMALALDAGLPTGLLCERVVDWLERAA